MGKPVNLKSVDQQSATGAGKSTQTLGHYHLTLFVVARNIDTGNDTLTVALEGSPDGTHWATAEKPAGAAEVAVADFTQDPDSGVHTASVSVDGAFHPYIRARITDFADALNGDLGVDAYVMASAWPEAGVRAGRET